MAEASTTLRHLRELARARAASLCGLAERGASSARHSWRKRSGRSLPPSRRRKAPRVFLPPLDGDWYPANTLEPRDVRSAQRIGQDGCRTRRHRRRLRAWGRLHGCASGGGAFGARGLLHTACLGGTAAGHGRARRHGCIQGKGSARPTCGGGTFPGSGGEAHARCAWDTSPDAVVRHLARNLRGFEIDLVLAWLSQVLLCVNLRGTSREPRDAAPVPDPGWGTHSPGTSRAGRASIWSWATRLTAGSAGLPRTCARFAVAACTGTPTPTACSQTWRRAGRERAAWSPSSRPRAAWVAPTTERCERSCPARLPRSRSISSWQDAVFSTAFSRKRCSPASGRARPGRSRSMCWLPTRRAVRGDALGAYCLASTDGAPRLLPRSPRQAALVSTCSGCGAGSKTTGGR